jgi:hypothetical protein
MKRLREETNNYENAFKKSNDCAILLSKLQVSVLRQKRNELSEAIQRRDSETFRTLCPILRKIYKDLFQECSKDLYLTHKRACQILYSEGLSSDWNRFLLSRQEKTLALLEKRKREDDFLIQQGEVMFGRVCYNLLVEDLTYPIRKLQVIDPYFREYRKLEDPLWKLIFYHWWGAGGATIQKFCGILGRVNRQFYRLIYHDQSFWINYIITWDLCRVFGMEFDKDALWKKPLEVLQHLVKLDALNNASIRQLDLKGPSPEMSHDANTLTNRLITFLYRERFIKLPHT